jgi:hypothetical protein
MSARAINETPEDGAFVPSLGVMTGWGEEGGNKALVGDGESGVGCEGEPQRDSTAAINAGRRLADTCCVSFLEVDTWKVRVLAFVVVVVSGGRGFG